MAQTNDSDEVHKIYVNQTTDTRTAATIRVEEYGTYQVTIFAIVSGLGILGSRAEHTQLVMAGQDDVLTTSDSLVTVTAQG